LATRCPNNLIPFFFGQLCWVVKNHNILQFDFILNDEASMLENFIKIFGMVEKYSSKSSVIFEIN
jgi:hypothetical protein